jgi:glucuronoarabinoxylan endo-1,4-beta-xylanase
MQTMEGFGASTGYVERNPNMNATQAASFFSTTAGIGLSWVRIQDCGSVTNGDCPQPGTTYSPDLPTLQLAVAQGAKVFITFDFPTTSPTLWPSQAAYVIGKLQYLQANGVTVSEISPVNEPSNGNNWTNAYIAGFIDVLGPALTAAGVEVPIALPEWESQFAIDFSSDCMADSICASYVKTAAEHGYATYPFASTHYSPAPSYFNGRPVWQTEVQDNLSNTYTCAVSQGGLPPYDPSMADGIGLAENVFDFLTNQNGSLWMYWNLASGYNAPTSCNDGLASYAFTPAKRFYVLGNWSLFVRPGMVEIGATVNPQAGVYVTAFLNQSTGALAIVAINSNTVATSQTFSLNGTSPSSLTPYVTDAGANNLTPQSPLLTSGTSFTYSLNPTSVTSFVSSK